MQTHFYEMLRDKNDDEKKTPENLQNIDDLNLRSNLKRSM